MKINSYQVQTKAARSYTQFSSQTTMLTAAVAKGRISNGKSAPMAQDTVSLSGGKQGKGKTLQPRLSVKSTSQPSARSMLDSLEELRRKLLDRMLEAFSGKKVKAYQTPHAQRPELTQPDLSMLSEGVNLGRQMMSFTTEQFYYESETVSYNASAMVNTADGRQIDIELQLNMSREVAQYSYSHFQVERAMTDPLVINFGGNAAELTQTKFDFDLDFDGRMDSISFAGQGSGFLALDKNGDGVINDGRELFGPATGSGFGELRAYDLDQNGWIDENDDIFNKLVVWAKNEQGEDILYKLKDLDIGAIYLGDTSTQFAVKDAAQQTQGQVQSTSFYLKESGGAGYIQHIDLMG